MYDAIVDLKFSVNQRFVVQNLSNAIFAKNKTFQIWLLWLLETPFIWTIQSQNTHSEAVVEISIFCLTDISEKTW